MILERIDIIKKKTRKQITNFDQQNNISVIRSNDYKYHNRKHLYFY